FENSICLSCGRTAGFIPGELRLCSFDRIDDDWWREPRGGGRYRKCRNYADFDVCNWMVDADDPDAYCRSCRLNLVIPDLSEARNLTLWYRVEGAKRRLLYTLFALRLPVRGRGEGGGQEAGLG